MRNIWVYVVGGMVAIGAIVSIKGLIGNNDSSQSTAKKPVVTATAMPRRQRLKRRNPTPHLIKSKLPKTTLSSARKPHR